MESPASHTCAVPDTQFIRINILIVNEEPGKNYDVIAGDGPWRGRKFNRIAVDETRKGERIQVVKFPSDTSKGVEFVLTPYSLTALTNRQALSANLLL